MITELDDHAEDSRAELLRGIVRGWLGEQGDEQDPDHYLPEDEKLREIYLSCLNQANEKLRLAFYRESGIIAQDTQTSKDALKSYLSKLERKGYVRRQEPPLGQLSARLTYRIKPRCADPDQWVYRRGK